MQRSRWGWGYANQLDTLQGKVKRAAMFFGALEHQNAIPDDAVQVPALRVSIPAVLQTMADTHPGKNHRGAVTLDMSRMQRLLEVDATSLTAHLQAGNGRS